MMKQTLQEVTELIEQQQLRIATAESCTGGLLAHYLTSCPGSTSWYDCGWVTYCNQAKHTQLGVSLELIQENSPYSIEVAKAMAQGALLASTADIAIAITGIAGPGGGSKDNPVGVVYFGWCNRLDEAQACRKQFPAFSRKRIQLLACYEALKIIHQLLSPNQHSLY